MKVGYMITDVDAFDVLHWIKLMQYEGVKFYLDDSREEEIYDDRTIFSYLYRIKSNTVWYVHPAWDEGVEQICYEDIVFMIVTSVDPDTVWDHAFYDLVYMSNEEEKNDENN